MALFYNKNHKIMANSYGLLGINPVQSAIMVPKPRNPYVYYIFTVDEPNELNADETTSMTGTPNDGLYSQVDMRLNNGLGGHRSIPKKRTSNHLQ
jgi:hypothetical protein